MSNEVAGAEPKKAPAKKGKLIIIGAVALVVVAGGGGGFWWFSRGAHASAKGEEKSHAEESGGGVVPLEPFLVNLADTGGSRYLRTTLKLVVPDEKTAERVAKSEVVLTRTRSAILELLATDTAERLTTPEGKSALKKAIGERVSPLIGVPVSDVLFADFVVQF